MDAWMDDTGQQSIVFLVIIWQSTDSKQQKSDYNSKTVMFNVLVTHQLNSR